MPPLDQAARPDGDRLRDACRYAVCMTIQIALRLPTRLVADVDRLVAAGRFASRTDVIRRALERFLAVAGEAELDRAIVEGYRRLPDSAPDAWVDTATRAMVSDERW
jgi:Arc/MetJ-type ribon-helix-helix transcriptional regulator